MTLREAIWETVLILPPSPTLGGEFGAGGGGSSCPLSLRNRWGRAEELQGWGPHSPPSPPSAIFFPPVWHIGIHLSWKYRRPPGRPLAISHSLQLLITPPSPHNCRIFGIRHKKGQRRAMGFQSSPAPEMGESRCQDLRLWFLCFPISVDFGWRKRKERFAMLYPQL